ncbi:pirin family protein [Legionella sp. W05-934-2]|uniref:pirin family protein n=1 Tax=Legionella sp. W05-934-2 TaxID=1198649 RepID=UPI003461AC56
MITVYPYDSLGYANYGWLKTHHHFSFAEYHNPNRMGFGTLRVINDDTISPGTGFDLHSHRDMEIITYVRQGAITHDDNHGNQGKTKAGNVQVMSAGTGISHAESNEESEKTIVYQIWIKPRRKDLPPKWLTHSFPTMAVKDKLHLLVSGDGAAPLTINQDAYIYAGTLSQGQKIKHPIHHQAYVLASKGSFTLDKHTLNQGDGAEVINQTMITITANEACEILIIDVPSD